MSTKLSRQSKLELAALASDPAQIDTSDLPETTPEYWQQATRGRFYRPSKQQITLRLDADIIDWLKQEGKGYQSRLNRILRDAMLESVK